MLEFQFLKKLVVPEQGQMQQTILMPKLFKQWEVVQMLSNTI